MATWPSAAEAPFIICPHNAALEGPLFHGAACIIVLLGKRVKGNVGQTEPLSTSTETGWPRGPQGLKPRS